MIERSRSRVVRALTIFLVAATVVQLCVTHLYSAGVRRLLERNSIERRSVRMLAKPIVIAPGQPFSRAVLTDHLRAVGYYEDCVGVPGCFVTDGERNLLTVWSRYPELPSATVTWDGEVVRTLQTIDGSALMDAAIEPETLLTLAGPEAGIRNRTSEDPIPATAIRDTPLFDAIIASEDRWFLSHHGLDFPRLVLMPFTGGGASTITMQVARLNVLQDRSRRLARKITEIGVAMAIDRAFSKPAILDAYVNSVGLGARGGRPIQGFGAAAREFFGVRDVRQLTGLQAATLVALLNQPTRYLDQLAEGDDESLRRQRNRVLGLMRRNFPSKYSEQWVRQFAGQPVRLTPPAAASSLHRASRHFLEYALAAEPPLEHGRIYSTLDGSLQRSAVSAVDEGLKALETYVRPSLRPKLEAALVAVDPSTGEIRAMVGGRSYDGSQLNRAISARRQVGSIMKPFDYLAALERARADGRHDLSPSTLVNDRPTVFRFRGLADWRPANYADNYAGVTTWRRALAESRNVAAVHVAAQAGFERVAALWQAATGRESIPVRPSIALGAVEATPLEVAEAYSIFATGGVAHPLHAVAGRRGEHRRVAHAETTRTVTDMLRAVMDEGTGRGARAAGFSLDAAGKTGTTNALRDAWFAGFSGNLLAVVWVGLDNDRPLGLSGAQAALPIWTSFMKRALQPAPEPAPRPVP